MFECEQVHCSPAGMAPLFSICLPEDLIVLGRTGWANVD